MSKVVGFMDVGRDWKFSESGIGNGGKLAGAAALLELGVWHRSVKLDGGGRRSDELDRQFGGDGAFLFFLLVFDLAIVMGGPLNHPMQPRHTVRASKVRIILGLT